MTYNKQRHRVAGTSGFGQPRVSGKNERKPQKTITRDFTKRFKSKKRQSSGKDEQMTRGGIVKRTYVSNRRQAEKE